MKYKVIIREIYEKEVLIDSENEYQALDIAQEQYDNWDIVLDDLDHAKVTFKCGEWSINRPKASSKHHSKSIEEEKEDIRIPKTVEDVLLHKLNIDNSKLNLSDMITMSNIPEFKLKLEEIKEIKEIPTACNHKCYLISKSDDYHIIYIPDSVTLLNDFDLNQLWGSNGKIPEQIFTNQIIDLKGTLKIVGGKNLKNINGMFAFCEAQSLDLSDFNTPNITEMQDAFHASSATSIDFTNFDTSNVTNMQDMFFCSHVKSLDLSSFDTSKVVNMNLMFAHTHMDSLDLSNFNTSNVTIMEQMFLTCEIGSLNLTSFNTHNVTIMDGMFLEYNKNSLGKDRSYYKNSIIEINPEKFFVADIKNLESVFADCEAQIKCVDPIHGTHFIDAREFTNLESLYRQYHSDLTEKDNDEYQYD